MNKIEFAELAEKLIKLGEDKDELMYWVDIYDAIPADDQLKLYVNLKKEYEALKK